MTTEINTDNAPKAAELKAAVEGYQKGSMSCTEKLYLWYRPLILALAHSYSIHTTLGEDAENIAWEKFYEFLKNYQGNDYYRLPGLIKKRLISRLADVAQSRLYYDPRLEYSDSLEDFDSSYDPWKEQIFNIHLKYSLEKLKPLYKKVIYFIYFEDKSGLATAKILNKNYHIVRYAHKHSLAALRNYYLEHKLIKV